MEDAPVFTPEALLNATCNDKELAAQVVEVFLADIPTQLGDLASAARGTDAKTAERVAHSIKGASATVGGQQMHALALECEILGREGKLDALAAKVDDLRESFDKLVQAMRENGYM